MPIGMPGCPDRAASTASIDNIRIAFARRRREGRATAVGLSLRSAIGFVGLMVASSRMGRPEELGVESTMKWNCRLADTGGATCEADVMCGIPRVSIANCVSSNFLPLVEAHLAR
jgi:hypothetical protein